MQVKDEGQKRGRMSGERTQTGGMDADRDRGEACVGFTCDGQKEYMKMLPDDLGAEERDCWRCAVQVSEKQLSSMQGAHSCEQRNGIKQCTGHAVCVSLRRRHHLSVVVDITVSPTDRTTQSCRQCQAQVPRNTVYKAHRVCVYVPAFRDAVPQHGPAQNAVSVSSQWRSPSLSSVCLWSCPCCPPFLCPA